MELKPYKKLTGLEYNLSKTVQFTEEFNKQFINNPFLVGNVFTATITPSTATINHGLGSVPLGWIVLDQDAGANIWKTSSDDKTITFDSSATVNIKVWIF